MKMLFAVVVAAVTASAVAANKKKEPPPVHDVVFHRVVAHEHADYTLSAGSHYSDCFVGSTYASCVTDAPPGAYLKVDATGKVYEVENPYAKWDCRRDPCVEYWGLAVEWSKLFGDVSLPKTKFVTDANAPNGYRGVLYYEGSYKGRFLVARAAGAIKIEHNNFVPDNAPKTFLCVETHTTDRKGRVTDGEACYQVAESAAKIYE